MSTALRILLVLLVQTGALVVMIAERQITLASPRVVTLNVVPVDPSDMYRGDYVVLRYDISHIDTKGLAGRELFRSNDADGKTIYVTLRRDAHAGAWTPVSLHATHMPDAPGEITLKGTIKLADSCGRYAQCPAGQIPATLDIDYGIESFFVRQGTGQAIEQERQQGGVSVDIAVDESGRAAIKAMRRKGRVFYVERLL